MEAKHTLPSVPRKEKRGVDALATPSPGTGEGAPQSRRLAFGETGRMRDLSIASPCRNGEWNQPVSPNQNVFKMEAACRTRTVPTRCQLASEASSTRRFGGG